MNTAVKFLENSRVQSSTDKMKRDFLTKKGLTNAEIELAFSKVSQTNPFQQIKEKMESPQSLVKQHQMPLVMPQSSFSNKLRDLLNILLLIGGASYGMRYLWKVRTCSSFQTFLNF